MVSWDFQRGTNGVPAGGTSGGTSETPAAHLRLGQRVIGEAMGSRVGDCRCPVGGAGGAMPSDADVDDGEQEEQRQIDDGCPQQSAGREVRGTEPQGDAGGQQTEAQNDGADEI